MIDNWNDWELRLHALNLWANYIETGNVTMSAVDASKAKKPFNALTLDQQRIVVRLRDLAIKELENNTK